MTSRSSAPYCYSLLLHGAIVALALLWAMLSNSTPPPSNKVFELVAGAGDNYGATAAPAIGMPGGTSIRLRIPDLPMPPQPVASPPAAEEAPPAPPPTSAITPAPAEAASAPSKTKHAVPNLTRLLEHTANRRASRLEAQYRKQLEAEQRKQISYAEYEKEHGGKTPASSRSARIDAEGIREGVVGGSAANRTGGAGGKALTREEGSLLDAYFALLKERLNENLDKPADAGEAIWARVEFYVGADGSISDLRFVRSSGNPDFDQAVRDAFSRTHSIGPRPDGQGDRVTLDFHMREDGSE